MPRALFAASVLLVFGAPALGLAGRLGAAQLRHRAERTWARLAVRMLRIDLQITGLEHIDPAESYVVVPLHEGFADIVALLHLPIDLQFVARTELADWRVLGSYLRSSGQITVDTERPLAAYRHLLDRAPSVFARGESLVVFPQGTILGIESAFSEGAFRLAERQGRPVLPIVLAGAGQVWAHPFSPLVRFRRTIRMEILDAIPAKAARSHIPELQRQMKQIALARSPQARRFVPERDGWWDDYRYEIDPGFPKLLSRVERHRADVRSAAPGIETKP